MKKLCGLLLFCIFIMNMVYSQDENRVKKGKEWIISGKVIDALTGEPLEYATVSVLKKENDKLITGQITSVKGTYNLIVAESDFYLKLEFLGYKTLFVRSINYNKSRIEIPIIKLNPDQEILQEVEIRAEKSQTVFKLDRREFNVGKDISNSGGSALEVLNNVPSVEVSLEGAVSLRGNSNVKILLNGKPSVLTSGTNNALGSITAEMIDKIEVVTNPSAKYDAEGTSGIINVVLKKDKRKGINGAATVNLGDPQNHSFGLSLSRRTEKQTLVSQIGGGIRKFPSTSKTILENKQTSDVVRFTSDGEAEKQEKFMNITLGADYYFNPLNVLTVSGHFGYEFENESSDIFYNNSLNLNSNKAFSSLRKESVKGVNPKYQYELAYKKSYKGNKDRSLIMSLTGSYFGKDRTSTYDNLDSDLGVLSRERILNDFSETQHVFQTDYTYPFNDVFKLELGGKYDLSFLTNNYQFEDEKSNSWVKNVLKSNVFDYQEGVLGLYSTFSAEYGRWGIIGGVRFENSSRATELKETDERKTVNYYDFFPTLHTSFKLAENSSLQLGYSKRIFRPHLFELNPFFSYRDSQNITIGNPDLKPEYTDSFELTTINNFNNASFNASVYYRNTTNVMTDYVTVLNNQTITKPENIGKSENLGFELNSKLDLVKWFNVLLDLNYVISKRNGFNEGKEFNFNYNYWTSRLTSKFKFPFDIDAEVRLRYRSKTKQIQGVRKANYVVDFGIKKKLFKGRAVVNFGVRNLLNSSKYVFESDLPDFYRYEENVRGRRQIVLGFSYSFGKGEAMQYSGFKQF
ncbi:MAG: TonB-dependent receptor domain-containing protein [Bacteroidales bacterium]